MEDLKADVNAAMSEQRVGTYSIPGPYGPGHPYYEAGRKNGADGKHAVMRDDETYMNGWADGYAASREDIAMTTDNQSTEPTEAQVEAAAKELASSEWIDWESVPIDFKGRYYDQARAALVAAEGVHHG